ncbi:MAG: bifunctional pyr operon transcriptional regulator/uracil phosphoribosyltransferase PyrR [Gammaproteobacteria bacterium]|nr:bifunctional pyr operon transcriptional regulator/uracil phosphoribosyltransferase PyrR [Gammaproteobacteria bacterium]
MYDSRQLAAIIEKMAGQINARQLPAPLLVGIHTGGTWLAEQLHPRLDSAPPLGTLDISFYRDDFSRVGLNPEVKASSLPVAVDNRDIILVDDVLHTGRTVRAGLNEIFSYGRPERVCLAVLIERPGRELPIQADIVGQSLQLAGHEEAKLTRDGGRLALNIIDLGKSAP